MGRRGARRAGRRTARRTTARRSRRRRRRRRRILVGGMVLLAGGAVAYKLTKQDADKIEQHTGASVEELSEEELTAAMRELGIQSIELTDEDQAIINKESTSQPSAAVEAEEADYLEELERLAELRDKGIVTEEEFQAKKKELLGL